MPTQIRLPRPYIVFVSKIKPRPRQHLVGGMIIEPITDRVESEGERETHTHTHPQNHRRRPAQNEKEAQGRLPPKPKNEYFY